MDTPPPNVPPVLMGNKPKKPLHPLFAIGAVLLFVGVQIIFGWDQAIAQGRTSDHAIGIEIGGVIGGLAIAGFITVITYFVARRSARAASIAFSLAMLFVSFTVVREWGARAAKREAETPHQESFGDFTFEVPAHWTRAKPVLPQTQALIVLYANREPCGMVQVDVGPASQPLTRDRALALEGPDAHLLPDPLLLDGTEAFRIERPPTTMTVPRSTVVLVHADKAYVIMAAQKNDADIAAAFDHVLQTWRWTSRP